MLTIQPVTDYNRAAACSLHVDEAQLAFVSPVATMLEACQSAPLQTPYVIADDEEIVGFCIVNFDAHAIAHLSDAPAVCGLQGYLIDSRYQGRGYGVRAVAALQHFLQMHKPDYQLLALSVNCRNEAAQRAYLKAGFVDTGRLYYGGRSGPQHIYTLALSPNSNASPTNRSS